MIKSLHIENIAVIEKTDIDFSAGFNVLTGETGAGKSIIIDAINAVLGERTSKDLIRSGCERAEVTALFCELAPSSIAVLSENGYSADEEGNLLITRILSASSSGSVKINGKAATIGILKTVAAALVNIHGQHDNQSLLDPDNHYLYIDRLADNGKLLGEYYEEFRRLNAIRRELNATETDEGEKKRKIDLLEYQINELQSADIKCGELADIKEKLQIADNYEKTVAALNDAYYCISGSEDTNGAFSLLRDAQKHITASKNESFSAVAGHIGDMLADLDAVAAEIRAFTQNAEFSELDGEKLRTRLDTLHRLMLKYGNSEEDMLLFLEKAESELQNIMLSDERIKQLSDELDRSTENLIELGDEITATRKRASEGFAMSVTEILKYLDMPNAVFDVDVKKGKYTKRGCDEIEFIIGTNAGEPKKPLAKIASGGELSRIMLGIKSILADKDDVDTLIFDEIDSGISGRAAGKVGVQLKRVSQNSQVICVTHLAQIAAFADNHLFIEKEIIDDRTYTNVSVLSYDERIHEVARIMSGTEITDNLYNSAKELLDRSNSL